MSPFWTFLFMLVGMVLWGLAAARVPERWVNYAWLGTMLFWFPLLWAAMEALGA